MSYIEGNKAAWEEAFENRKPNWGMDTPIVLKNEKLPFFNTDMKRELNEIDFNGKAIAQFCCNNGRELLSLMQLGAASGIGFDIAENIIGQAKDTAERAGIKNCNFLACNILDIPESYENQFDFIIFTIGAITWFEDLKLLFEKVAKCLKNNGQLLIHDFHPLMNMLPLPGEESFDSENLNRIAYSYFRKEPWIENTGMGYMTTEYESKTFISFSHTMSDIINSLSTNGLKTVKFNEYNYDIGLTDEYDDKGFPLSFILVAVKG